MRLTIQITSGYQNDPNGHDVLSVDSQYGITGSFDAASGTLTLTGSAYVGDYREVLRSVKFRTSGIVNTGDRVLTIIATAESSDSAVSSPVTRTVRVSSFR